MKRLNIPGGYAEACLARSEDAMKSFRVASFSHSSNAPVEQFITGNVDSLSIKSIREFHAMKCLNPFAVSFKQYMDMRILRGLISDPVEGTMMVKVLRYSDAQDVMAGAKPISSFVTRLEDVSDLTIKADVISGLRLEPWFTDNLPIFRFECPKGEHFNVIVPYPNGLGGIADIDTWASYPCTGFGFTATVDGTLRPEWLIDSGTTFSARTGGVSYTEITNSGLGNTAHWDSVQQDWVP